MSTPATRIRPCIHPRCDDGTGNPSLTTLTMCDPCRHRVTRTINWLIEDYTLLKTTLPTPVRASDTTPGTPTFGPTGHPSEWASDTARLIAVTLNETENALRDHLGHDPAVHPHVPEPVMLRHAHRYLTAHLDDLCTFPGARAAATEFGDLHHEVRRGTGQTRFQQRLPTPCPTCDVAALIRYTGHIICESCGRIIREEDYGLFARIAADAALDDLIDQYDTLAQAQLEG